VHRGDQHGGQRCYVGAGGDPPEVPLCGEVPADHGRGLGEEGKAGAGGGAQPGAQLVTRDDQPDEREDGRAEQLGDRGREVARDAAGSGRGAQVRRLAADPGDPVKRQPGEERVEVGEVPVQHPLGDPSLGGDRPAGQRGRAVAEQDPLGGVEQLPARVADGHSCGHVPSVLSSRTRLRALRLVLWPALSAKPRG
jgi:hypothetical protein